MSNIITGQYVQIAQTPASVGERIFARLIDIVVLFIYAYDISYTQLMNADFVSMELIRGLSGSLGMILTVPTVSFAAACILAKHRTKENES